MLFLYDGGPETIRSAIEVYHDRITVVRYHPVASGGPGFTAATRRNAPSYEELLREFAEQDYDNGLTPSICSEA